MEKLPEFVGERQSMKMVRFLKLIYGLSTIPTKASEAFFTRMNEQAGPKFSMEIQGTWNNQRILKNENKVGGLMLLHLKTYCKAIISKIVILAHGKTHRSMK